MADDIVPGIVKSSPNMKDYTGQKFGCLTAVRFSGRRDDKTYWIFLCECGRECEKNANAVKSGGTVSCGCLKSRAASGLPPLSRSRAVADLSGKKFGRLTVVKEAKRVPGKKARRWSCLCDCGAERTVLQMCLANGMTKSCGCLQRESAGVTARVMGRRFLKHGEAFGTEWRVWSHMRERCNNVNFIGYKGYGGRGIRVCDRWSSFDNFLADMGRRPSTKHGIGRIDNDGGYEPSNCRWETHIQQHGNKRSNRLITHDGRTLCLAEWADVTGIRAATISRRIKNGASVAAALTRPVHFGKRFSDG